jgi:hypothetical protein
MRQTLVAHTCNLSCLEDQVYGDANLVKQFQRLHPQNNQSKMGLEVWFKW